MEWNNAKVLEFLDLYEQEPIIWNPLTKGHKDKNNVYDAWKRIQTRFQAGSCSIKRLKSKRDTLMATYRKLYIKVIKAGKAANMFSSNKDYKPEWFAYEKMDSFLNTVYTPRETKALIALLEENVAESSEADQKTSSVLAFDDNESTVENEMTNEDSKCSVASRVSLNQKRKRENEDETVEEVFQCLKPNFTTEEDQCTIFCQLIASQMRMLNPRSQAIARNKIQNIIFELEMEEMRPT